MSSAPLLLGSRALRGGTWWRSPVWGISPPNVWWWLFHICSHHQETLIVIEVGNDLWLFKNIIRNHFIDFFFCHRSLTYLACGSRPSRQWWAWAPSDMGLKLRPVIGWLLPQVGGIDCRSTWYKRKWGITLNALTWETASSIEHQ